MAKKECFQYKNGGGNAGLNPLRGGRSSLVQHDSLSNIHLQKISCSGHLHQCTGIACAKRYRADSLFSWAYFATDICNIQLLDFMRAVTCRKTYPLCNRKQKTGGEAFWSSALDKKPVTRTTRVNAAEA